MAGKEPRIYEYMAQDGTVFWSFTRYNAKVSNPLRLVRQSNIGMLLPLFLVYLKKRGQALFSSGDVG